MAPELKNKKQDENQFDNPREERTDSRRTTESSPAFNSKALTRATNFKTKRLGLNTQIRTSLRKGCASEAVRQTNKGGST